MPRFISLIQFTEEGLRATQDSTARESRFAAEIEKAGGQVESAYWCLGEYDGVLIFQAPDQPTAVRLLLQLAQQGFVRTRTMQAFDAAEFEAIAGKKTRRRR